MAEQPVSSTGVDNYSRYGDYLSAQMQSNRSFGYGLFICRMQAAPGPVCSAFWLYSNAPSAAQSPDVAQNWNWNEVDFEFVPFTQATQAAYATFAGGLPKPNDLQTFGATVALGDPRSQTLDPAATSWTLGFTRTDEAIAQQMWAYYNTWMGAPGAPPSGGTFVLEDGTTGAKTGDLAYNISSGDLQTALNKLNSGTGLFGAGPVTVTVAASGGSGNINSGQLNQIDITTVGLIGQLSGGEAVSAVGNPGLLPEGTFITEVDQSTSIVTLSQAASAPVSGQTFQFTPMNVWSVGLAGSQPVKDVLIIDTSDLTPKVTLGSVIAGLSGPGGNEETAFNVSVFQPLHAPARGSTWWKLLVDQTGPSLIWPDATTWKYPLTSLAAPSDLDMTNAVALNYWRSPAGQASNTVDFTGWPDVTHTGILRVSPIPGTSDPNSFTSAVLNNEAYLFDTSGNFAPYSEFHTYTIAWTPTRVAQYIDAPNGGRDISNATPVAVFDRTDFPSVAKSGPQAPGAEIPWISSEMNMPVGNVTINLANYVAFMAAGAGPNPPVETTGSLTANSTAVTVSDPSGIFASQVVSGAGVPAGATVTGVNGSIVTMSLAATTSGTGVPLQFVPTATVTTTGDLATGSPTISNIAAAQGIFVGQQVSGAGVPEGTTVTGVAPPDVIMSANASASSSGAPLTFTTLFDATTTGDLTQGSTIITNVANPSIALPGQSVSGQGIQNGTSVVSVNDTMVTLTQAAAASGTGVALTFATMQSGVGWSGPPPGSDFTNVAAFVQTIGWYPLIPFKSGKDTSDFDLQSDDALWLDFSDGTWTASDFATDFSKYFGILYAQDFTSAGGAGSAPLRDSKSPLAVSWVGGPNGTGAMQLACASSVADPARNFFVLLPSQESPGVLGPGNPLVRAVVQSTGITLSANATQNGDALLTFTSTTTGDLFEGITAIFNVADPSLVQIGQSVSGQGIATGTVVTDVNASAVTINWPPTSSGTAVAVTFVSTTTATLIQDEAAVTLADPSCVVAGQAVTGTGVPAGTTVARARQYYAATSSVGTPTAFYAPPANTSVELFVGVWTSSASYFPQATVQPYYTAEIIASTSAEGAVSWAIKSDPKGALTIDPSNPFRIAVAAPSG
ncbi:hypothetical protein [Bradyrhizobium oligotrophicum]|uniref:hypothetical protein n=1 Tax=Bradyrhizobium oligotrophicum TaxID=44255 RepID=UPI003EBDCB1F